MLREQHPGLAGDWVFPSRAGTLLSSGSLSAPMRRARKVAQIGHRVTAHGLRRTLNTLALQVAPSETIRAIMGHTTAQMTEHYNAPAIDARREVLGRVVEMVHGAATPTRPSGDLPREGEVFGCGIAVGIPWSTKKTRQVRPRLFRDPSRARTCDLRFRNTPRSIAAAVVREM